ncbi:MAG TPA: hypothetical protein DD979_18675 [Gammaproteobacteria bacterium]|nr:hypothetical protein [Gammaproteobacteria bacterium]
MLNTAESIRARIIYTLTLVLLECGAVQADPPGSSLHVQGVTYAMAQQVRWLSEEHFLVGRWDGSISLFAAPPNADPPATLVNAMVIPGGHGVQMLVAHHPRTFVSSADEGSLLVWQANAKGDTFKPDPVPYPTEIGVAVSGLFVQHEEQEYLLTGHEHGRLLIWSVGPDTHLDLHKVVDLRSEVAIDYQHADTPLRHIRGLAMWRDGIVITGGEDGALHQVQLPGGEILSNRLFNAHARLGVNDLVVHGNRLLVVNCATGPQDRNLWLYDLHVNRIADSDAANLLTDPNRARIFAFDIATWEQDGRAMAGVTTKEGLLWRVAFDGGELAPMEHVALGRFTYGAAIDVEPATQRLAAAGIGVRVVDVVGQAR